MSDDPSKRRLGRGLAALMGDAVPEAVALDQMRSVRKLPVEQIVPNPRNPRVSFSEAELADLAGSIVQKGIVQPLLVRQIGEGAFEIIAGERRWRAAQQIGLDSVPVVIRDVDERESLELAIIENVQRADLNAIEEARGYQSLIEAFAYTQHQLSEVIGKSRSHIANTLRLLNLPDAIISYVAAGTLSPGHARQLIGRSDAPELARRILDEGLSVRQIERLVQVEPLSDGLLPHGQAPHEPHAGAYVEGLEQSDARSIEATLAELLGLEVSLKARPNGSGRLSINYRTLEQLDGLLRRLGAV
jgi:ParB family transcriptional regulator, chromosome partitioning protein